MSDPTQSPGIIQAAVNRMREVNGEPNRNALQNEYAELGSKISGLKAELAVCRDELLGFRSMRTELDRAIAKRETIESEVSHTINQGKLAQLQIERRLLEQKVKDLEG